MIGTAQPGPAPSEPASSRRDHARAPAGSYRSILPAGLIALVFMLAFGNALLFSDRVSISVANQDDWYVIAEFVYKDFEHGLTLPDFFVKRSAGDHAQPLNKLIQRWHARHFDLDFGVEGIIGVLAAALTALLLLLGAVRALGANFAWRTAIPLALIPAALMSLNGTMLWSWTLVTLFFTALPFLLLTFVAAASVDRRAGKLALVAGVWLALLVQDNPALIAVAALLGVSLLRALLTRHWRPLGWAMALALAGYVGTKLTLLVIGVPTLTGSPSVGSLIGSAAWHEAWRWPLVPAAMSVAVPEQIDTWLAQPSSWTAFYLVGAAVLMLHGFFWWSALRTIHRGTTFVAASLMTYAYLLTLGIIAVRVPQFGSDYLFQPRYVIFYQLCNVALLLQAAVWMADRPSLRAAGVLPSRRDIAGTMLVMVACGVFAYWQIAVSIQSWDQARHMRRYEENMARTLFCVAAHPEVNEPVCQPILNVCDFPPEIRRELLDFMQRRQLNLFSPDFQARNRLMPPADPRDCIPPAAPP